MSVLEWMDIIYPFDVAVCVGYTLSKIAYRITVRGRVSFISPRLTRLIQRIIEADIAIGMSEIAIMWCLNIMTGVNPRWNIDEYRFYVAWGRVALGVSLLAGAIINSWAVVVFWNSLNRGSE